MSKLQLPPATKLAPATLKIAVELLLDVLVKAEPEPQLFAAGRLLIVALGITPAMSIVNGPSLSALPLSGLVSVKGDVKVPPAAIVDESLLIVNVGAAMTCRLVETAVKVVADPNVRLIVLLVLV